MSRTTELTIKENPCKRYIQWSTLKKIIVVDGEEIEKLDGGAFSYYNKETKEKLHVKLPFKFAVLDKDLVTFRGYNDTTKMGCWSGEYRTGLKSNPNQIVSIRNKEKELLSFKIGDYKINKDAVKGVSAKFTQSVYIAVEVEGEWEIWNIGLSGGAFNGSPEDFNKPTEEEKKAGWMNFTKNNRAYLTSNFIEVNSYLVRKKGSNKFVIPEWELGKEINAEDTAKLNALDTELQEYLSYYFDKPSVKEEVLKEEVVDDSLDY